MALERGFTPGTEAGVGNGPIDDHQQPVPNGRGVRTRNGRAAEQRRGREPALSGRSDKEVGMTPRLSMSLALPASGTLIPEAGGERTIS